MTIEVIEGKAAEHLTAIRALQTDVAFIADAREWPDCEATALWSERLFLAVPEGHELAGKDKISWHDLIHEVFIVTDRANGEELRIRLKTQLERLGADPDMRRHSVRGDNLLPLVATGWGLTLKTEAATAAHIPGVAY